MSCDIADSATCLEINESCSGTATLTYPEKFYRNLVPNFTEFERKFDSVTLPTLMYVHFNVLTFSLRLQLWQMHDSQIKANVAEKLILARNSNSQNKSSDILRTPQKVPTFLGR